MASQTSPDYAMNNSVRATKNKLLSLFPFSVSHNRARRLVCDGVRDNGARDRKFRFRRCISWNIYKAGRSIKLLVARLSLPFYFPRIEIVFRDSVGRTDLSRRKKSIAIFSAAKAFVTSGSGLSLYSFSRVYIHGVCISLTSSASI